MDRTLELIKLAKEGNQDAKEQVVTENLGLVWAVARRFLGRGHELEDLYQIGCIGLMKCIEKFDLSFDVKFSTYAVPMITGEIKRFLRDDGMIKVSRTLKETSYKVKKVREDILNQTGEEPKLEELSKLLDIDMEEIVTSLEANVEVESIHKTIYQNDGNAVYLMDKIANVEDENETLLDHLVVEELMNKLESQEQKIIEMRYFENRTQTEIAKEMNISQVQVSRLEKKILLKMRGAMSGGW
jgi:RNA polymerase sporulation-specific sigma factor